jgi:hypothetical protein
MAGYWLQCRSCNDFELLQLSMNSTIRQFSKPAKSSSSSKASSLPPEVKKFAKQMGLNLTGLEAEAEDIWEMLTKMSMNNPLEYESFVAEQLKNGKLNENTQADASTPSSDAAATSVDSTSPPSRMIRPKVGFCVVCMTTGNDGIKVRVNQTNNGKKFYINFCSHEGIEVPKDKYGQPVYDDRVSADGMEIPLVIGPHRDIDDNQSLAIDVIVHPLVIARSESHNVFRSQIVDLGLQWVANECPVQFNKRYQQVTDKSYAGGRGADKATPVLLSVDEVLAKQEGRDPASASSSALSVPAPSAAGASGSSLLSSIKQAKFGDGTCFENDEEEETPSLIIGKKPNHDKRTPAVIEEINPSGTGTALSSQPQGTQQTKTKPKTTAPLIKKGFLNNSKSQPALYPEGSQEGTGGATGGSYSRLMSRCQVVDATSMQSSAPPSAPSAARAPAAAPTPPNSQSVLSKSESRELDSLMCGVDEDWNQLLGQRKPTPQVSPSIPCL